MTLVFIRRELKQHHLFRCVLASLYVGVSVRPSVANAFVKSWKWRGFSRIWVRTTTTTRLPLPWCSSFHRDTKLNLSSTFIFCLIDYDPALDTTVFLSLAVTSGSTDQNMLRLWSRQKCLVSWRLMMNVERWFVRQHRFGQALKKALPFCVVLFIF